VRTFLRIAPDDSVQAAALLIAAHDAGCSRMAVLRSGSTQDYSAELGGLLGLERARFDVRIVSTFALPRHAAPALPVSPANGVRRWVVSLRGLLAGCLAYLGSPSAAAPAVLAAVHTELPRAPLFASDRLCQALFAPGPLRAELAAATGGLLQCTLPALPATASGVRSFISLWQNQYGGRPPDGPWAVYGYEAMRLALRAIAGLGSSGDQRSRVLHALFAQRSRSTLLGSVAFSPAGDSTLRAYGLWQVRASGPPDLLRVMEPSGS
jgi:ABC-type branched-subunit amino acid transport system substrate-binding protein